MHLNFGLKKDKIDKGTFKTKIIDQFELINKQKLLNLDKLNVNNNKIVNEIIDPKDTIGLDLFLLDQPINDFLDHHY